MGFSSMAQDRPGRRQINPEQRAEWVTASLKEKVELPEEKWEQLSAIKEEYFAAIKELRAEEPGRPDRAEIKALKSRQDEKLQQVLTEEEYAKLQQALMEIRSENRGSRGYRNRAGFEQRSTQAMNRLKEQLDLSDEKWEQLKEINQEYLADMKTLKESRDEKLKTVLTEEEFARLQQLEQGRRSKTGGKERRGRRGGSVR